MAAPGLSPAGQALFDAVVAGDIPGARAAFAAGATLTTVLTPGGSNALQKAAFDGVEPMVRFLDFACVSTTALESVAVHNFASSALPLVFKVVTKNCLSRGADISFLSVYPTEQEALYPPLTYLRCLEMKMETLSGVQLLVATVEPMMA